jgi:hypothetical protein
VRLQRWRSIVAARGAVIKDFEAVGKNKRTPDSSLKPSNDALAPESGRIAISCLSTESSLASTTVWRSEKGRCVSRARAQERLLTIVNRGL